MFCPNCKTEYPDGTNRCSNCQVALVADTPETEDHTATPYAMIFETSEVDVVPVIKSLLDSAEIPYDTSGEAMMNLFPSDMLGNMMGRPGREIRFHVPEDRAEEAKALLKAQPVDTPELRPNDDSDL